MDGVEVDGKIMKFKRVKGHGRRATFIIGMPASSWHVKLRPTPEGHVLSAEAQRLKWAYAKGRLPVTKQAVHIPFPYTSFLITKTVDGIPGHKLIDALGPERLTASLASAIDTLQSADVQDMSFPAPAWLSDSNFGEDRLNRLDVLRRNGKKLHPDFDHLDQNRLRRILKNQPATPQAKVTVHGDLCMPNMLFSQDGELTGVIDLGAMHAGDALIDKALLSWCIKDNLGLKWSEHFLKQYGLSNKDPGIQYYRLLYDLSLTFPDPWAWTMTPKMIERRQKLAGESYDTSRKTI